MPGCGKHSAALTICISKDVKNRLERLRRELGISVSELVELTLRRYLERAVRELTEEMEFAL